MLHVNLGLPFKAAHFSILLCTQYWAAHLTDSNGRSESTHSALLGQISLTAVLYDSLSCASQACIAKRTHLHTHTHLAVCNQHNVFLVEKQPAQLHTRREQPTSIIPQIEYQPPACTLQVWSGYDQQVLASNGDGRAPI